VTAFRFPPGSLVRVESPGEDAEVDRLLRGAAEPARHGEIVGGRAWYDGFARALVRIEAAAAVSGATLLGDPAEILVMFDKAACHTRLLTAGVPVPPALPASPSGWDELRSWLDEVRWHRVFIKPRHGSSASGVIALQLGQPGRILATTSAEISDGRLFNSLRVRTYRDERDVATLVDRLAGDGLHIERWFPKASLGGRVIDLRVVAIGGEPSHIVVRGSRSPMTNLHLGGVRGDIAAARAAAGEHYCSAMRTCRDVAACFPGSRQLGIDLMFAPSWRRHAIAEVNAFGDLLPGLLVDGRDTYAAQIAALVAAR
jgi:glutathione synthase/RimK-type ligase-like ATP-grasp enzyme